MMIKTFLFFLFPIFFLLGNINSPQSIYKSLQPNSLSQLFAFYELYPETKEGKKALQRILSLLSYKENNSEQEKFFSSLPLDFHFLLSMINLEKREKISLTEEESALFEKISFPLAHRHLKGFGIKKIEELHSLTPEEIDLARALFLLEMGEDNLQAITFYEACLDLMALQISLLMPINSTMQEKINAINDFIFFHMQFRFPPHSLYSKDIDKYSFLPSVMEKRQGVCLGISVLYLCLAQRLDLPLQAVTPPGHIFVRGFDKKTNLWINIETTMRGVNIEDDEYLSFTYPSLQVRNNKEVIGLVFINQAAALWQSKEYEKAIRLYEKTLKYLPEDPLVLELLGYNLLFIGKEKEAKDLFHKVLSLSKEEKNSIIEDYLKEKTNIEGIKIIFQSVNNTKDSILKKQNNLKKILKKYPSFRAGIFQLATTFLQLGRTKNAHYWLNKLLSLDQKNVTAYYYQALISLERYDFPTAWKCFFQLEKIFKKEKKLKLKKLNFLRQKLKKACHPPEKFS